MKRTDFPLKKTFTQEFITKDGKNLFTLKYEQATIEEYDEYMYLNVDQQVELMYNFVKKQIPLKLYEKILTYFIPGYISLLEQALDMPLIIKNISINRFRTYKSIFDDVPMILKKQDKGKKWLYSANLAWVCQKYNIDVIKLRKEVTLEQYMWMIDGIIFSNNELSKEGQAINKYALIDKDEVKKRAERTKELFSTRKIKK